MNVHDSERIAGLFEADGMQFKKNQKGVFVFVQYLAGNAMVAELERNLRMWDDVIKYQTVLVRNDVADALIKVLGR